MSRFVAIIIFALSSVHLVVQSIKMNKKIDGNNGLLFFFKTLYTLLHSFVMGKCAKPLAMKQYADQTTFPYLISFLK